MRQKFIQSLDTTGYEFLSILLKNKVIKIDKEGNHKEINKYFLYFSN